MKHRIAATILLALLAALLFPARAGACLWDRDTLAHEAQGQDEVVNAVVGWFDRNPPLYYEMRIKLASAAIEKNPGDLGAYDDAAVACDRIGRGDEALEWMERKSRRLDALDANDPAVRDHRYRFLANTGTFWVHRWARNGADRGKLAEVEKARDYIARAIELNPNAHFGREKYQLKFLEWIIAPPNASAQTQPAGDETSPTAQHEAGAATTAPASGPAIYSLDCIGLVRAIVGTKTELGTRPDVPWFALVRVRQEGKGSLADLGYGDADKGLAGLVTLGNAWESVDAFTSLWLVMAAQQRWTLCVLAQARIDALLDAGKGTLSPDFATRDALREYLQHHAFRGVPIEEEYISRIRTYYTQASAAAQARHEARQAFMMTRLEAGRHPDTDPHFWDGYREPSRPWMPGSLGLLSRIEREIGKTGTIAAVVLFGALVAAWMRSAIRRRAARRAKAAG
ncbi:MAG: hypothetical protein NTW19_06215 [Planctomycetota bacterium]|nr:hypothetical protein [Planctomycetota bacterium]